MKFHLNYTPEKSPFLIDHTSNLFLIGSCFADNIGSYLKDFKFKTLVNPGGILFNPLSIYNGLISILQNKKTNEHFILERDGIFYSYAHHTSLSAPTKEDLVKKVNSVTEEAFAFLKTSNILILTFGTAFYYYQKALRKTAANCHKQPASLFDKRLLKVEEITKMYSDLISQLKIFNPNLKIIFTVSPVKYLKDGVEKNNLSKSILLLSIHKLVAQHTNSFYFPAFELVNDDLRDYRFYKEDLAHPNDQAVEYIWQKFSDCYFDPKTIELNYQIQKLNLASNHRQMEEKSLENEKLKAFIEKQKIEIKKLNSSIEF